jgi:hypothetical protein
MVILRSKEIREMDIEEVQKNWMNSKQNMQKMFQKVLQQEFMIILVKLKNLKEQLHVSLP